MERNILKIEKPNNGKIGQQNWFASFPPAFFLGGFHSTSCVIVIIFNTCSHLKIHFPSGLFFNRL
jgi:hypothetical protein